MNFYQLLQKFPPGTILHKPNSDVEIKGLGFRRSEPAIIYYIDSNNGNKRNEKGFNGSEFHIVLRQLKTTGSFTRAFFEKELKKCYLEGGCTYTTIGAMLEELGIAEYRGGKVGYVLIQKNSKK